MNKIENPTKINAINQVLIQINRNFSGNPFKLIRTSMKETKNVVTKLIVTAKAISFLEGLAFIYFF